MATLFEQTAINGMTVRNRLVRSATWEGMCDPDGRPNDKVVNVYKNLAQGGVGLIISGFAFVRPDGKALPGKMGIHTDDFEAEYKKLIQAVHDGGSKIAIQLVHAGGQADPKSAGRQPLAPSAVEVAQFQVKPAEFTKADIRDLVRAFGEGARRAKAWGADAVQFHGAHGYLINQFLSPLTNRRTDEYGGSIENRCRFMMEVYQTVRKAVGDDYPVFIKLNITDNLEGGLEIEDGLYAAEKLGKAGIDAIEVSSGTPASGKLNPARMKISKPEKEAYHLDLAKQVQQKVACPVMVVGGFRSYEIAENAVGEHGMDFISMSRPLIREPNLPNRWLGGDHARAKCVSCNKCFGPGLQEGGIYCVVEKKEREKKAKGKK